MTYRKSTYGPFERGKTYELEFRARAEHRTGLVDRDLSDAAIEIHFRLYTLPLATPATFIVDQVATKLTEGSAAAGATGLFQAIVTIPRTAPIGSAVFEVVVVDTGVVNLQTPSGKREIPLAPPAETAVLAAPTSAAG